MKKCAPRRIVKSFRDVRYMVLLVLMVSVFSSCKKDAILEAARAEKGKPSPLTEISYASFLDQVSPQRLGDLAKTLSVGSVGKKNLPISFYGEEAGQLIIETGNLLRMQLGDTVCYVFSIKPQSRRNAIFQNLTIQLVGNATKAFLTTYYPDKEWIDAWRKKIGTKFNGRIQVDMLDLNIGAKTAKVTRAGAVSALAPEKIMLLPGECETVDVWGWVNHPCSTGCAMGQCAWEAQPNFFALSPAQRAEQGWEDGKSFMPYRSYDLISSTTNCAPPAAVYPGGGGNTGGGGGSTTPNPPGDYDPCDNGPVAVTSFRSSQRYPILGVPPSDCDPDVPNNPPTLPPNDYLNAFQRLIGELGITDQTEVQFLQDNGNVFVALNNYLNANNWSQDSKDLGRWAVGYLRDFPNTDINELINVNNIPNSTINLPNLDTSELGSYPAFKALVEDLPNFLNNYPNILRALEYTTGFKSQKIIQLMQPGKGPKVRVVSNLKDSQGTPVRGTFNRNINPNLLQIDAEYVNGLGSANNTLRFKELGFILLITTLHEFVHYGRATNDLSKFINQPGWGDREAGNYFEDQILPPGTPRLEPTTAKEWLKYYKIRIITN